MIDITYIILSPEYNAAGLRRTINSVRNFSDSPCISVVGKTMSIQDTKNLESYCPVYKGGATITSLIDEGLEKCGTNWGFITVIGSWLTEKKIDKYKYFAKSDKDVLFPVIDRKIYFDEGSINGILINKKAIKEVGKFGDEEEDIRIAKLLWCVAAIDKKYIFKGIVGCKFF